MLALSVCLTTVMMGQEQEQQSQEQQNDSTFRRGLGEASVSGGLNWIYKSRSSNIHNVYGLGYAVAINRYLAGTVGWNLTYYGNDGVRKERAHEWTGGMRLALPNRTGVVPYLVGAVGGLRETVRIEAGRFGEFGASTSFPVAGGGAGVDIAILRFMGFRMEGRVMAGLNGHNYFRGLMGLYFRAK
jgi:hypothetical protein